MLNISTDSYKKIGISLVIGMIASVIVTFLFFVYFRQRFFDEIAVWQYKSTVEIVSLVNRAGMNENGKFYFIASKPKLYSKEEASDFNKVCVRTESTTAILGCYRAAKIYIYKVTDNQLDGINEVTAAHEMLHAVYDRMSDDEKQMVNKLIEDEFSNNANNKDFTSLMDYYNHSEPGQRDKELFSIIGTTVAGVSIKLEDYYVKYFSNRQNVVDLSAKYKSVFATLKNRADELLNKIDTLSAYILSKSDKYNINTKNLNDKITNFNNRLNSGAIKSQWQINSEKSALLRDSDNLDSEKKGIQSAIDSYQAMQNEYNSIASESQQLTMNIDSNLATVVPL